MDPQLRDKLSARRKKAEPKEPSPLNDRSHQVDIGYRSPDSDFSDSSESDCLSDHSKGHMEHDGDDPNQTSSLWSGMNELGNGESPVEGAHSKGVSGVLLDTETERIAVATITIGSSSSFASPSDVPGLAGETAVRFEAPSVQLPTVDRTINGGLGLSSDSKLDAHLPTGCVPAASISNRPKNIPLLDLPGKGVPQLNLPEDKIATNRSERNSSVQSDSDSDSGSLPISVSKGPPKGVPLLRLPSIDSNPHPVAKMKSESVPSPSAPSNNDVKRHNSGDSLVPPLDLPGRKNSTPVISPKCEFFRMSGSEAVSATCSDSEEQSSPQVPPSRFSDVRMDPFLDESECDDQAHGDPWKASWGLNFLDRSNEMETPVSYREPPSHGGMPSTRGPPTHHGSLEWRGPPSNRTSTRSVDSYVSQMPPPGNVIDQNFQDIWREMSQLRAQVRSERMALEGRVKMLEVPSAESHYQDTGRRRSKRMGVRLSTSIPWAGASEHTAGSSSSLSLKSARRSDTESSQVLRELKDRLAAIGVSMHDVDGLSAQCAFKYKGYQTRGSVLHLATLKLLMPSGSDRGSRDRYRAFVRKFVMVLQNAFPDALEESCTYQVDEGVGSCKPIHLAAWCGNYVFLEALLEAGADVHAKSTQCDQECSEAIHEAVWHDHPETVDLLLRHKANVNAVNMEQMSSLHVACLHGLPHVSKILLDHQANCNMHDKWGRTPLELAEQCGVYDVNELHHLATKLQDLEIVARNSAQGSAALVQQRCGQSGDDIDVDLLTSLVWHAPSAVESILHALCTGPIVKDAMRYPIPTTAEMEQPLRCAYQQAKVWGPNAQNSEMESSWQSRFLPLSPERGDRVHVRVVPVPDIVNASFLSALSQVNTAHLGIFSTLVAQGTIEYAWKRHTQIRYVIEELQGWVLVGVLVALSLADVSQMQVFSHLCWSVMNVVFLKELSVGVFHLHAMNNSFSERPSYKSHVDFRLVGELFQVGLLGLLVAFCYQDLMLENDESVAKYAGLKVGIAGRAALAFNLLVRWPRLLYGLRASEWLGTQVLPLLGCFYHLPAFLLMTLLIFCGFAFALLAINSNLIYHSIGSVFWNAFKFMFMGNVESLDKLQEIGLIRGTTGVENYLVQFLIVTTLVLYFTCVVHYCTTVLVERHKFSQKTAHQAFLKERAAICSSYMIRWSWLASHPPDGTVGRCLLTSWGALFLCTGCAALVISEQTTYSCAIAFGTSPVLASILLLADADLLNVDNSFLVRFLDIGRFPTRPQGDDPELTSAREVTCLKKAIKLVQRAVSQLDARKKPEVVILREMWPQLQVLKSRSALIAHTLQVAGVENGESEPVPGNTRQLLLELLKVSPAPTAHSWFAWLPCLLILPSAGIVLVFRGVVPLLCIILLLGVPFLIIGVVPCLNMPETDSETLNRQAAVTKNLYAAVAMVNKACEAVTAGKQESTWCRALKAAMDERFLDVGVLKNVLKNQEGKQAFVDMASWDASRLKRLKKDLSVCVKNGPRLTRRYLWLCYSVEEAVVRQNDQTAQEKPGKPLQKMPAFGEHSASLSAIGEGSSETENERLSNSPRRMHDRLDGLERMVTDIHASLCMSRLDAFEHHRHRGELSSRSSDLASGNCSGRQALPAPELVGLKDMLHVVRHARLALSQSVEMDNESYREGGGETYREGGGGRPC